MEKAKETKKVITQEDYDKLPGNVAASFLNGIGEDGQPILKYAQCNLKSGEPGIEKYWVDEEGQSWRIAHKFIANNEY